MSSNKLRERFGNVILNETHNSECEKIADEYISGFPVWLVKNNYVSLRGNIWIDTNIEAKNKTYTIDELREIYKKGL